MFDKYYVGADLIVSSDDGKYKPVSRVTLAVDDNNVITSGDDSGMEVYAFCPHATQEMVDALLEKLRGYVYQAFEAEEANLNPSAELGDGVTAGGVYGVISKLRDDGSGYVGISAPGKAELEDEYPMDGPMSQMINRQLAGVRSSITKTAEEIRLEVSETIGELGVDENGDPYTVSSLISQTATGIETSVKGYTDGKIGDLGTDSDGNPYTVASKISQTAESITSTVTAEYKSYTDGKIGELGADDEGNAYTVSSAITQTAKQIRQEVWGDDGVSETSIVAQLGLVEQTVSGKIGEDTANTLIRAALNEIELSITNNTENTSASIKLSYKTPELDEDGNPVVDEDGNVVKTQVEIDAGDIKLSGLVTIESLKNGGSTVIDGSRIQTGQIDAKHLKLSGALKFSDFETSTEVDEDQNEITYIDGKKMYVKYLFVDAANIKGKLTVGQLVDGAIPDVSGFLTDDDLGSKGTTVIDGGRIQTGTIESEYLRLTGLLTVYDKTWDKWDEEWIYAAGGYIGYDDGFNSEYGIGIRTYLNGNGAQVVCTDAAARISFTVKVKDQIEKQTGVTCGPSVLTLEGYSMIQMAIDQTALVDLDEDGLYPADAYLTLGTADYPWADVYAAGTSMSDLLKRVEALEKA